MTNELTQLTSWLKSKPSGVIEDVATLTQLLARVWDLFAGSDEEKTKSYKLHRMESPIWSEPLLTFQLERHGAASLGSTRASIHFLELDISSLSANIKFKKSRVVKKQQARLDVNPIAQELADLIVNQIDDPRLKWSQDRSVVTLQMGKVIPDNGPKETTNNRRGRLRESLVARLEGSGWKMPIANKFSRIE
jgi:hypothetical protein